MDLDPSDGGNEDLEVAKENDDDLSKKDANKNENTSSSSKQRIDTQPGQTSTGKQRLQS